MSFTCPHCGAVSYHPKDIEHGYCGRCHDFTRSTQKETERPCGRPVQVGEET